MKINSNFPINDDGWSKEWPTEPNSIYWFYGWRSAFSKSMNHAAELFCVNVWKASNLSVYVANGQFMSEEGGAIGLWKKADVSIPSLDNLQSILPKEKE